MSDDHETAGGAPQRDPRSNVVVTIRTPGTGTVISSVETSNTTTLPPNANIGNIPVSHHSGGQDQTAWNPASLGGILSSQTQTHHAAQGSAAPAQASTAVLGAGHIGTSSAGPSHGGPTPSTPGGLPAAPPTVLSPQDRMRLKWIERFELNEVISTTRAAATELETPLMQTEPFSKALTPADIQRKINVAQAAKSAVDSSPFTFHKYTKFQEELEIVMRKQRLGQEVNFDKAEAIQQEIHEHIQYREEGDAKMEDKIFMLRKYMKLEAVCRGGDYFEDLYGETSQAIKVLARETHDDSIPAGIKYCTQLERLLKDEEKEAHRDPDVPGKSFADRLLEKPIHKLMVAAVQRTSLGGIDNAKSYIRTYAQRNELVHSAIKQFRDNQDWDALGRRCDEDLQAIEPLFDNDDPRESATLTILRNAITQVKDKWVTKEEGEELYKLQPIVSKAFDNGIRRANDLQHFANLRRDMSDDELDEEIKTFKKGATFKQQNKTDNAVEKLPIVIKERADLNKEVQALRLKVTGLEQDKLFTDAELAAAKQTIEAHDATTHEYRETRRIEEANQEASRVATANTLETLHGLLQTASTLTQRSKQLARQAEQAAAGQVGQAVDIASSTNLMTQEVQQAGITQDQALQVREQAVLEREQALQEREQALQERESNVRAGEQQAERLQTQMRGLWDAIKELQKSSLGGDAQESADNGGQEDDAKDSAEEGEGHAQSSAEEVGEGADAGARGGHDNQELLEYEAQGANDAAANEDASEYD